MDEGDYYKSLELLNDYVQCLYPLVNVVREQFVVLLSCISDLLLVYLNQYVGLVGPWNFNLILRSFQDLRILRKCYLSLWSIVLVIPQVTFFVKLEVT